MVPGSLWGVQVGCGAGALFLGHLTLHPGASTFLFGGKGQSHLLAGLSKLVASLGFSFSIQKMGLLRGPEVELTGA